MDWWYGEDYYGELDKKEEGLEGDIPWDQVVCIHSWKPILLLTSTVYDCTKCKIKKEDYEKWQKNRKLP